MQTLFSNIISNLTKTSEYFSSEDSALWWYSFKYLRNGSKYVLPVLEKAAESSNNNMLIMLGTIIARENDEKWSRLGAIYFAEYNALQDYSITESYSGNSQSNQNERINTKSNHTGSTSESESIYGFNSATAVGSKDRNTTSSDQQVSTESDNNRNLTNAILDSHSKTTSGHNRPISELYEKEWVARKNNLIELILTDISYYLCVNTY